jgi:hypothetical protein
VKNVRLWIRAVLTTEGALRDAQEHLTELARAEDSLSTVTGIEKLHYQRGKVDGIKAVLFQLTSAK